ncbi:MAG: sn-glycerol-3-phosphate ABC transporter permease UgpA [Alphaproteobacteria bacterium]|nr:sn-glycerol-3-phosphate ABC transporter permease UgpA [Alphaproteobacteria bacterium]
MNRRVIFRNKGLPYLLVLPQLVVTVAFFFLPAGQAIYQSTQLQDPFGLNTRFVWFENFWVVLSDPLYLNAVGNTAVFSIGVTVLSMSAALWLATLADRPIRFALAYKTLLIWPYAVAPAVAALLWLFVFHPSVGIIGQLLRRFGVPWDYQLNGSQAMALIIFAAAWKQVSYNFLFFLAGLQAIPKSVIEAASIDGAGPTRRFWTIIFPLLSPTTFFLLVVNIVYAFFDTFGIIHALTQGGPGKATETLIYKVYVDGVVNLDLGGSAAQSVILMIVVIVLTAVQFRYVERKVQY